MKKALITGVNGQDGSYLASFLLKKGYQVFGGLKSQESDLWRLKELSVLQKIELITLDLLDSSSIEHAIDSIKPDEVYNLAAQSSVAQSFRDPLLTQNLNTNGTILLLQAITKSQKKIKFFQASSSEMIGINTPNNSQQTSKYTPTIHPTTSQTPSEKLPTKTCQQHPQTPKKTSPKPPNIHVFVNGEL